MRVLWVSAVIVFIDQLSKVAVVQLMQPGESIPVVGEWLRFTFTQNPGMAFGITAGPRQMMTVFSIVVTVLVLWYLYSVRSGYTPYLVGLALIFGGAVGNIIDRVFYAWIRGGGDFLMGKVVDFIHVDLWRGTLPEALPVVGGHYTALFPIWNVADMAIVVGVVCILIFQRRFHQQAFEQGLGEQGLGAQDAGEQAAEEEHLAPEAAPSLGAAPPPPSSSARHRGTAHGVATARKSDTNGRADDRRHPEENGHSRYAPPGTSGAHTSGAEPSDESTDRPADE